MQFLKRFDDGIARGEGAIAAVVLVAMILVASIQAALRNLTYFELSWANDALGAFDWADQFLKKGTLWLAFLGASLATRDERHIGIDVLPKLLPPKSKLAVRGIVGLVASGISFFLARAFWAAVLVNAEERPPDYEVWADTSAINICDATAAQLEAASLSKPALFCGLRSLLGALGAPVESPAAAAQLIVPIMFVMIAVRLFANGVGAFLEIGQPEKKEEPAKESAPPASRGDAAEGASSEDEDASEEDASASEGTGAEAGSEPSDEEEP